MRLCVSWYQIRLYICHGIKEYITEKKGLLMIDWNVFVCLYVCDIRYKTKSPKHLIPILFYILIISDIVVVVTYFVCLFTRSK